MVCSAHDLDTMMLLRHADNRDTMLLLLLRHAYKNGHNDAAAHNPWCNAAAAVLHKCKALKLRVDFPVLCHRDACMSFSLITSLPLLPLADSFTNPQGHRTTCACAACTGTPLGQVYQHSALIVTAHSACQLCSPVSNLTQVLTVHSIGAASTWW